MISQHFLIIKKTNTIYQPTYLYYDQIKKRLFIKRAEAFFIADVSNLRLVFYTYLIDIITNFNVAFKKNKIFLSGVLNNLIIDYSQILQNNNPFDYQPKFLKIDNQTTIHINDNLSVFSLYKGTDLINQISLKQFKQNNFQFSLNLNYSQLFIFIADYIFVLDFTNNVLKLSNQINLESKFLKTIKDTKDNIIILLQSQKLVSISKQKIDTVITELTQLPVGLCIFTTTEIYIIFSDCISNDKIYVMQISSLNFKTRQLTNQVIDLRNLGENNSQIAILTPTSLILFDLILLSQIKEIVFNYPFDSVIEIDLTYNRIYLVNQFFDTTVFNFTLDQLSFKNIESFGLNIQLEDKFIYYIATHSANIYFRKDLSFFFNFRIFNSTLTLKKITYLNIGYFFLVEFVEQISLYEFSPFILNHKLVVEIPLSNYALIDFQLIKQNESLQDYLYILKVYGVNFQSTFNYSLQLDIYQYSPYQSCQFTFESLKDNNSIQNSILILNEQLMKLKQTFSSLLVKIESQQILKFPNIIRKYLSNFNFDLYYSSNNQLQPVKINSLFAYEKQINNLKLSNMQLNIDSENISSIYINPQIFKGLKKLHLKNIILKDLDLTITDLNVVIIENLKLESTSYEYKTSLTIRNVQLINIVEIEISGQKISIYDSFIKITQSIITYFSLIKISNVHLIPINSSLKRQLLVDQQQKTLLSLDNIDQLNFDTFIMSNIKLENINFLDISNVNKLSLRQIQFYDFLISNIIFQDYFLNKFMNITEIKLNEYKIKNLKQISKNSIIFNKFSQIQSLIIEQVEYTQIYGFSQEDSNFLIHLESIQETMLVDMIFANSENFGFLNAVRLSVTSQKISSNIHITLQNIQILNLLNINQLININSLSAKFLNLNINNISISKQFEKSTIIIQTDLSTTINDFLAKQVKNNIYSLIQLTTSRVITLQKVIFSSISTMGSTSCMIINKIQNLIIEESSFENNYSVKDSGSIYVKQVNLIKLIKNKFKKNISEQGSGGAIYCDDSNFEQISENIFSENETKNGSGGAIYLINCEVKLLSNNKFDSNFAFIGGAIRYQQSKPFIFFKLNGIDIIKKTNSFYQNSCISYGKDIGSYPIILDVKNFYEDDFNSEAIQLENVPSGQKLEEPLKFRFIDEEQNEVTFFNFQQYKSIDLNIIQEFESYILLIESQQIGLSGDLIQRYKLDQLAFVFDISYSFQPEKSQKVTIKSTQALPQFTQSSQKMIFEIFQKDLIVFFRKCHQGEIMKEQGKHIICDQCNQEIQN